MSFRLLTSLLLLVVAAQVIELGNIYGPALRWPSYLTAAVCVLASIAEFRRAAK